MTRKHPEMLTGNKQLVTLVDDLYNVLPRWRIAFAFKPGDILFFNSRQNLHGNLPFEGNRLSAIFFCTGRIATCGKNK